MENSRLKYELSNIRGNPVLEYLNRHDDEDRKLLIKEFDKHFLKFKERRIWLVSTRKYFLANNNGFETIDDYREMLYNKIKRLPFNKLEIFLNEMKNKNNINISNSIYLIIYQNE